MVGWEYEGVLTLASGEYWNMRICSDNERLGATCWLRAGWVACCWVKVSRRLRTAERVDTIMVVRSACGS
jgi:hypothetical protein